MRADYLIAADGHASPVRQRLGVPSVGPGPFFHTITIMIEADLGPALRGRRVNIAYLGRPSPGTILMAHDDIGHRWVFGTGYAPERGQSVGDYTDGRCTQLVRAAAGLPDVAVKVHPQIPGTDLKVLGFPIGAQVAEQYRVGRVFLAAVVRGQAGPALLDSYHAERHPVGLFTMGQALARWHSRVGTAAGAVSEPLVDYAAVALGYQYRSSAVLGAPWDGAPALLPEQLSGQPGTRAPHLAIILDGREISTIDLYRRSFVLLAGADGAGWVSAAGRVAPRLAVPLAAYRFGVELAGAAGTAAHGIGTDGALLVRPDGFVGWRTVVMDERPEQVLEEAFCRLLGREAAAQPGSQACGHLSLTCRASDNIWYASGTISQPPQECGGWLIESP